MSERYAVGAITLLVGAATDVGRRRRLNEDSFLVAPPAFIVADGMGGYDAGDGASRAVVEAFATTLDGREVADLASLRAALNAADDAVAVVADGTERGAGSTVVGAVVAEYADERAWVIFNVGDSRAYLFDAGVLRQVTVDHSLGQELFERGELTADELATFPNRNVITRAIGATDARADSWWLPIVTGQRLLLCSDGLTTEVDDRAIATILAAQADPASTATRLVAEANAAGGRDNITAVVVDVIGGGLDAYPEEIDDDTAEAAGGGDAGPVESPGPVAG